MTTQSVGKQRVSLTLDPHVVAMFQAIAVKSGTSLSALINDWLETTGPALEDLTNQILEVKTRPAKVLNDLLLFQEKNSQYLESIKGELRTLLEGVPKETERPEPAIGEDVRMTREANFTPHSNTGVKLPPPSKEGN